MIQLRSCSYSHTYLPRLCKSIKLSPRLIRGRGAAVGKAQEGLPIDDFSKRRRFLCRAAKKHFTVALSSRVTVFPAGKKQARVVLPACILVFTATDVMERRAELSQSITDAIGAGATGVLLEDDEGTGAATVLRPSTDVVRSQHGE